MNLTNKQKKFYKLLKEFFDKYDKAPKLTELKDWLNQNDWEISSLNSLTQYLEVLEQHGKIERTNKKRGIKLTVNYDSIQLPLLSSLASCGSPTNILDENVLQYVEVSKSLVGNKENIFLFKVTGDSMDLAGIFEGDYVLVEHTNSINENDIVLATINDCCTVKRFKRSAQTISLLPESTNNSHKPIYLHANDDFVITGKVIHILKN